MNFGIFTLMSMLATIGQLDKKCFVHNQYSEFTVAFSDHFWS